MDNLLGLHACPFDHLRARPWRRRFARSSRSALAALTPVRSNRRDAPAARGLRDRRLADARSPGTALGGGGGQPPPAWIAAAPSGVTPCSTTASPIPAATRRGRARARGLPTPLQRCPHERFGEAPNAPMAAPARALPARLPTPRGGQPTGASSPRLRLCRASMAAAAIGESGARP